jgi:ABC-2 type transport system ATP-binding protein
MKEVIVQASGIAKIFPIKQSLFRRICKPFGRTEKTCVLKDVSFDIEAGKILGVVGPNGAGKTTLFRILADVMTPENGEIFILGKLAGNCNHSIRRGIGYISSDERNFFWRLTGRQNLEFFGKLYGLTAAQIRMKTAGMLHDMGLDKKADHVFGSYSSGMRKKLAVIRALMHEPSFVLLDEVTNSLDQESSVKVKKLIRSYVCESKNRAAIWSTHRIEEIDEICDKVMVLKNGSIGFYGSINEYQTQCRGTGHFILKVKGLGDFHDTLHKYLSSNVDVEVSKNGDESEYVIREITHEYFANIVSMTVKDFGAYIVFAGCVQNESNNINYQDN